MDEDAGDHHEAEEEDAEQDNYFLKKLLGKDYNNDNNKTKKRFSLPTMLSWQPPATVTIVMKPTFYITGQHVQELAKEWPLAFPRLYFIQESSFAKLCQLVGPSFVHVNAEMLQHASKGKGRILSVEIANGSLPDVLHWLSGGSYLDICLSAVIRIPSFYRCAYDALIDAILLCNSLAVSFPTSH